MNHLLGDYIVIDLKIFFQENIHCEIFMLISRYAYIIYDRKY